ncbi:WD40 repeat-like protein [Rhizopogon salebrosus TDB-379]|nr:WD40 repeat-like protein [Rhizopogon salebrosus TDB-379]
MQVVSAVGDVDDISNEEDFDKTIYWQLWVHDTGTGKVVAGPLDGHTNAVLALDISPDGSILASGSYDRTVNLWDTTTWQRKGDPLKCEAHVIRVRFSPTGQLLGVGTDIHIQIWDLERRERLVQFKGHTEFDGSWNRSLTWTRDGAHLLSAGDINDPVIRSWDTFTWTQARDPWTGHGNQIIHILLNSAGTLLASASTDNTVRLWQLATGVEVSRYEHSNGVLNVAFSVDGCFIFGADMDGKTLQWEIPEDVLAAARDALVRKVKTEADSSRRNQKNTKAFLDVEITAQRRNTEDRRRINRSSGVVTQSKFQSSANANNLSYTRLDAFQHFFHRMRPLADTEGRRLTRRTPEVADVPLGDATYRDYVAGEEDGVRPYSIFFCLGWFQKKPDPPRQLYDVDLVKDEQEEDLLDVPIPTTRVRLAQQEDIELTPMASQSQSEAGPSCAARGATHRQTQSS